MGSVHPTAIVSESARIGEGTTVGPYSIIGPDVVLGRDNKVGPHVVLDGHTTIGDENTIFQFASVGAPPQDLKYHGEPSRLIIGSKNIIREYVTLQPGTEGGGMETRIGDKNLFMAGSHVGHDGIVGNGNIFANYVSLAGHVTVGNFVTLGGYTGVHQFVKLGDYAILGAGSMAAQDIAPYCIGHGDRAELIGLNQIGLQRHGFSGPDIARLRALFRAVISAPGKLDDKLAEAERNFADLAPAKLFLEFIRTRSERGIAPPRKRGSGDADE